MQKNIQLFGSMKEMQHFCAVKTSKKLSSQHLFKSFWQAVSLLMPCCDLSDSAGAESDVSTR